MAPSQAAVVQEGLAAGDGPEGPLASSLVARASLP